MDGAGVEAPLEAMFLSHLDEATRAPCWCADHR
jgi:hypothetical protein